MNVIKNNIILLIDQYIDGFMFNKVNNLNSEIINLLKPLIQLAGFIKLEIKSSLEQENRSKLLINILNAIIIDIVKFYERLEKEDFNSLKICPIQFPLYYIYNERDNSSFSILMKEINTVLQYYSNKLN
jgi:hypothetical protein